MTDLVYTDPTEAIKNAEYLRAIAPDPLFEIRALLLKAEIFRMAGLYPEAIQTLFRADSLTSPDNYRQQFLINGLLATNYRESKHPIASRLHLEKAQKIISNIESDDERNKLMSNILQEMAYVKNDEKAYEDAITLIYEALSVIKTLDPAKHDIQFSTALNHQIIGDNFVKLEKADSSYIHYNKALEYLDGSQSPESSLKGYILNGLARTAVLLKNYDEAEKYFREVEQIGKRSENNTLLKDFYFYQTAYYKEIGDKEKYISSNEEYLALIEREESLQKNISQGLNTYFKMQQQSSATGKTSSLWYVFIGGTLVISIILLVRREKSKIEKEKEPKEEEEEKKAENLSEQNGTAVDKSNNEPVKEYMSEEAMDAIAGRLRELEKDQFYLDRNLSLASVAAEVGVNHRYLSHTIHNKFGKDFTTYINDLRIDYIIDFLKSDARHLNYKISYLAEISGFSSHNRFSIIFKKSKGMSPSELIQQLQEEQQESSNK
ncbi:MAG TPA: helix-turn-helix domain-containing protein [Flavobacteriaceae bacterium]|nr:helix-turn-helix domain-containing protein [Flavobacteriaceae bacterium]